jgi:hypothetical protein
MTSGRIWAARLGALMVAIIIPACQSTNPGAVGVSSSSLWISGSGIGGQPGGTLDWWHDPNTGQTDLFVPDPYDIVTYTRPIIWILGLNHPLMTDVQAKQFPNIVYNEQRALDLINQQREKVFVYILGKPLPYTLVAKLTDHTGVRQNCRGHSKHYAVWHPSLLPASFPGNGTSIPVGSGPVNAEGDFWYNPDPAINSRFERVGLAVAAGWELPLAGPQWRSGDDVATYWIANFGKGPVLKTDPIPASQVLLNVNMTHMSVGFWQLGGSGLVYYWTLIVCKDPNNAVTLPNVPFGGVGL